MGYRISSILRSRYMVPAWRKDAEAYWQGAKRKYALRVSKVDEKLKNSHESLVIVLEAGARSYTPEGGVSAYW